MSKPTVQRWEYRSFGPLTDEELNELGRDGWELIAALPDYSMYQTRDHETRIIAEGGTWTFKRPLTERQR